MSDEPQTVLEWTYEPPTFFEEPVEFAVAGGMVSVAQGKVEGRFDGSHYAAGREFRDSIHEALLGYFLAQQVRVAKTFTLSPANMARVHPDGRRDVIAFLEPVEIKITGGQIDFIITGANGEIKTDTKAERLRAQKVFREGVMQLYAADHVTRRLLQMFNNAQNDPENKLVHLYEIRDCLAHEFGGDTKAKSALSISETDWSRFGKIANNEPVLEGRHRGRHSTLRKATTEELEFCTSMAQKLIEQYVWFKVLATP